MSGLFQTLLQGGAFIMRDGKCILDCPVSPGLALLSVGIVITSVAVGAWLRRSRRNWLVNLGTGCLVIGAYFLFTLNHAGRNWGIMRSTDPVEYYEANSVSALCLLGAAAGATIVKLSERKR
jgi:hypothetical protein